jgi:5-oxopent-3-ene-1,2,5-tricarboxylate decarboxylase / 2-hydroxyhepta-2,4-diene-1,7-dioate isomerase
MNLQTVYGNLMHHGAELVALGDAAFQAPYNAPPQAPVLYIKPANTFCAFDGAMHLPAAHTHLRARACVGLLFTQNQPVAGIKSAQDATELIVNRTISISAFCDFTLPHESFLRPPVKFNALDGSLGLPREDAPIAITGLERLSIETWVNGACVHRYSSIDWLRSVQEQLCAVNAFIAFEAGDVLMLGCPPDAPLVKVGDVVEVRVASQIFTRTRVEAA